MAQVYAWHLRHQSGAERVPPTVTAAYTVKLLRPMPADGPITLRVHVVDSEGSRAVVKGSLEAGGKGGTFEGVIIEMELPCEHARGHAASTLEHGQGSVHNLLKEGGKDRDNCRLLDGRGAVMGKTLSTPSYTNGDCPPFAG